MFIMVAFHLDVPASPIGEPGAKHNSPRTGMPKRNAAIINVDGYAGSCGVIISAVRKEPVFKFYFIYTLDDSVTVLTVDVCYSFG